MNIPVVTSKMAAKDLVKIREQHTAIIGAMTNQKMRVDSLKQQQAQDLAAKQQVQMATDLQSKKDATQFGQNQQEIDVKRAALSNN